MDKVAVWQWFLILLLVIFTITCFVLYIRENQRASKEASTGVHRTP